MASSPAEAQADTEKWPGFARQQRIEGLKKIFTVTQSGKVMIDRRPEELLQEVAKHIEALSAELESIRLKIQDSMAQVVRRERLAQGLTLEVLAARAGVGMSSISQIENKKFGIPSEDIQQRLANGLHVQFKSLADQRPQERFLKEAILEGKQLFGLILSATVDAYNLSFVAIAEKIQTTNARFSQAALGRIELGLPSIVDAASAVYGLVRNKSPRVVPRSVDEQRRLSIRRMIDREIGRQLRKKRSEKGYTIEEVLQRAGIKGLGLSNIEHGYYAAFPVSMFDKLAGALGTDRDELLSPAKELIAQEQLLLSTIRQRQEHASAVLAQQRREKGVSLPELSRLSGLSIAGVHNMDRASIDMPVTPQYAQVLANALGSTIEDFWPESDIVELEFEAITKNSSSSPVNLRQVSSPVIDKEIKPIGGIDFTSLPIVTQAIGNLSKVCVQGQVPISVQGQSYLPRQSRGERPFAPIEFGVSSAVLQNTNLDEEWRCIEKLVNAGIEPSPERIKGYIQASCINGNMDNVMRKVVACIGDILRQEEETCTATEPVMRDILVVLESINSPNELRKVFAAGAG